MYSSWGSGNYLGFNDIPFQCWDVDDPANPRQLNVIVRDRDTNGRWDLGTGDGPYNYVWVMADDYDPTGQAWDASTTEKDFMNMILDGAGAVPAYYTLWGVQRGSRPFLARDGVLTAFPARVNTTADVFTFTAPAAATTTSSAQSADLEKVRVVPNPYYGYHSGELDPFDRWIQFTFLPEKCTVRVFDLAGNLIRKLEKNDADTPFLQWDMKNEYEIPVASGIYVFHVEAPGIGEKIGKLAIFSPNERLDTY
jgi:hypothetical protein